MNISELITFLRSLHERFPEDNGKHNITYNPETDNLELSLRPSVNLNGPKLLILTKDDDQYDLVSLINEIVSIIEKESIANRKP
jgi:hypothetical protein